MLPDWLEILDRKWFIFIHCHLKNDFFDTVLPIVRNKLTWIPLYLLILSLTIYKYKWKALWFILFFLITIALADMISAKLIKPYFERLRPCNDNFFCGFVKPLVNCGSGYSFVSSHASNHFALAIVFITTFLKRSNRFWLIPLFVIWASLIAFAQVYVGVHYPIDVIAGALVGIIIGYIVARILMLIICIRSGKKI